MMRLFSRRSSFRAIAVAPTLLLLVTGQAAAALGHDASSAAAARPLELYTDTSQDAMAALYDEWKVRHSSSNFSSNRRRLRIFAQNAAAVTRHNQAYQQGRTLYAMTLQHSPFGDMSADEFATHYLMDAQQNCSATTNQKKKEKKLRDMLPAQSLPKHVDWRTAGIITPVKNQKHCGSCWTFSTTGTLEAHTCLHSSSNRCVEWRGLAEQQLLDCAGNYDNHGCNGGLPSHAFEYIKETGGLDAEAVYPYRANSTDGHGCTATFNHPDGGRVAAVYNISAYDEDDLVSAIAQVGPVSIAYQVSPDFRLYSHGVYDSFNATTNKTMCQNGPSNVNHAVVAVGYGVTEPNRHNTNKAAVPYYIVRNSWSSSWGMEGYFWMKRGENLCGVSDCASFPIVPSSPLLPHFVGDDDSASGEKVRVGGDDAPSSSLRVSRG